MDCAQYQNILNGYKKNIDKHCLKKKNHIDSDICFIHDLYTLNDSDKLIAKKQAISCLNETSKNCNKILDSDLARKNLIMETNMRLVFLAGIFIML